MKGAHGHGASGLEIGQADLGGWVRVSPAPTADLPQDLPVYLAQTLADWFRQRPHFHLRCVVPIPREGDTVELHGWYDVHVLPPSPLGPAPKQEKPS